MFANGEANKNALPDFFALEGEVRNFVLDINLNDLNKEYGMKKKILSKLFKYRNHFAFRVYESEKYQEFSDMLVHAYLIKFDCFVAKSRNNNIKLLESVLV